MKKPKTIKRFCPFCKIHQEIKVIISKKRTPFSTHHLAAGSKPRQKARGVGKGVGTGNAGKYSRKPIKQRKMSGKKQSTKTDFRYECKVCKKASIQSHGIRAKKVELV